MSKKIALHVGSRRFDVDVADDFAPFLLTKMQEDFNIEGNNEIKTLLQAYIRKNYDLFIQEQNLQQMLNDCNNLE